MRHETLHDIKIVYTPQINTALLKYKVRENCLSTDIY